MAIFRSIVFSIIFALMLNSVSAENCPKAPIPVTPEQHRVLTRANKEMEKGRNRQALKILSDFSPKNSEAIHPQIPFLKGLIQYRLKAFKNAEMQFKEAIQQDPCFGEAWQNLAAVYHRQEKPARAADAMERAFSLIRPENPGLKYQAALLYLQAGKPNLALPLLESLATQKSPEAEWLLALSQCYGQLSQPAKAALAMEKVNRLKPDPEHQYQAACLWIAADRPKKALPLLETLCKKTNIPSKYRTALAQCLETLGKNEEAARLLAGAKSEKGSKTDSFRSALLHLKNRHPQEALPVLQELAKEDNPDPQWLSTLAMTLEQLERPEEACNVMNRVDINCPSLSSKLRLQMAIFWLHHNRPDRALPLLETLLKDTSASKACRIAHIEALVQTGNPKAANPFLKRLLNRYPEDDKIWRLQAWAAIEQKDYGKAAAALEVAFRLDSPDYRDWKRLGNLYRLAAIPEKAAEAFIKAFQKKEPTPGDLDLLAATYAEAHQVEKALAVADLAAKRAPTAKRFARSGQLYMLQERYAEGMKAFQRAAGLNDDGGIYSLKAGYAAWKLNQLAFAKTEFQSALQKADPKSQTAHNAAQAINIIEQKMKRQSSDS